jgi:uncharacterized 2Fe-2S/4Fe-4S cluster protein (DUF4445 family)
MLNPQVAIGEDVISRITYIIKNKALIKAKKLIIDAINDIIYDCCTKAKIPISCVKDISVVGNTGMHHIFFGVNPQFLSLSPYIPVFKAPVNISAERQGLKCDSNVNIYSPPVIAGYIGTDTIGCIIASKIYSYDKYSLLIDIGTNGELILGNNIGEITPLGICGSGLIDIIAEMLKLNVITRAGKFNLKSEKVKKNRRIIQKEDGFHYIIYHPEWDLENVQSDSEDTITKKITISQNDINQIQLAKGAFLSAANLLIDMESKKRGPLEQILLAGAFGTYIDKANAAFIGLFPEVEQNKIFQIGNAAGIGAQLFIKDIEQRTIANEIAHKVRYREIASNPLFQKEFIFSLYFPHYDLNKFPLIKPEYDKIPLK